MNDYFGPYFPTYTGRSYVTTPFFYLAADALPVLLENANRTGLIKGIISELVDGGWGG